MNVPAQLNYSHGYFYELLIQPHIHTHLLFVFVIQSWSEIYHVIEITVV